MAPELYKSCDFHGFVRFCKQRLLRSEYYNITYHLEIDMQFGQNFPIVMHNERNKR